MDFTQHIDKDNLHHAYLIEGERNDISLALVSFLSSIGFETKNNPDFLELNFDSIKIDDARNIKEKSIEKGFSDQKRFFVISANNFLLEAQNTLLKLFEEPSQNTHYFLIVPDSNAIIKTLYSRFYVIKTQNKINKEIDIAEKFLISSLQNRISFIKEFLLKDEENEEENNIDSPRAKAIRFLNAIEDIAHKKMINKFKNKKEVDFFDHLFKVREFLNMPGASIKTLLESVALSVPVIK